ASDPGARPTEIWRLTAGQLADAYARRSLGPVEVLGALIDRIEHVDPMINGFCFIGAEDARSAARDSEDRWRRGEALGPLDGVPVTIKDFFMVRGWPTRRGSRVLASAPADTDDAPAVARLREAGAVLLGKTTTTEMGHKASSISPLTGITRNPWNPAWSAGGSSCGAGAAAAAGLGPLHLGSDAAGSIRIPASFCGIYGHKPTSGLVPAYPPSASGHLAVLGPMTRTVEDARLMLEVMARRGGAGWRTASPQPVRFDRHGVEADGLRLALARGVNQCVADGEILARLRATAASLDAEGAIVEEIDLTIEDLLPQFLSIWNVFVATSARSFSPADLELIEPSMVHMIGRGRQIAAVEFNAAHLFFADLTIRLTKLFQRFDALLLPTLPFPAFAAEAEHPGQPPAEGWLAWAQTCFLFNATAMPASSIPCGFLADGRPIGLQVVGPAFSDDKVMAICQLIEGLLSLPRLAADSAIGARPSITP
ncbi:MAG: amidase, partial [Thermomicrobiales bacterium]|nr:amidase [Thermomicrobiales bacterium]